MKRKSKKNVSRIALEGMTLVSVGGATTLSKVILHPLDRLKIIFQTRICRPTTISGVGVTTYLHTISSILKTQGVASLWRGLGPHLMCGFSANAVRLSVMNNAIYSDYNGPLTPWDYTKTFMKRLAILSAAAMAGIAATYPMDVAYTRLAADLSSKKYYNGFFHCMRLDFKHRGLASIYRGVSLSMLTSVPYILVSLLTHDFLACVALPHISARHLPDVYSVGNNDEHSSEVDKVELVQYFPWNVAVGVASGLAAQSATYPLDTIRTRMQYDGASMLGSNSFAYKSLSHCTKLSKQGGIQSLYAGFPLTVARAVPHWALITLTYWTIKNALAHQQTTIN
eukprot:Platyproteum_vivax@DN4182_c0_g1_i1.p1